MQGSGSVQIITDPDPGATKNWRIPGSGTLFFFYIVSLIGRPDGRGEDYGEGPGADAALREEVHADARQHSGRLTQDTDAQVTERHGAGYEGN